MTAQAIGLWVVVAVVTLPIALALATNVQTPPARDYIVPAYVALVLTLPVLHGVALSAEMWLGREWRSLLRNTLMVAPHLPDAIEQHFRSFAGTFMTGRTVYVGFFVG